MGKNIIALPLAAGDEETCNLKQEGCTSFVVESKSISVADRDVCVWVKQVGGWRNRSSSAPIRRERTDRGGCKDRRTKTVN